VIVCTGCFVTHGKEMLEFNDDASVTLSFQWVSNCGSRTNEAVGSRGNRSLVLQLVTEPHTGPTSDMSS
jgi:hypothetical protein